MDALIPPRVAAAAAAAAAAVAGLVRDERGRAQGAGSGGATAQRRNARDAVSLVARPSVRFAIHGLVDGRPKPFLEGTKAFVGHALPSCCCHCFWICSASDVSFCAFGGVPFQAGVP
eukprot:1175627-Prorocentrum_minimum.AAC.1